MDFVLAFPEQLGIHLKSLRKAAGLRQAELATLLGVSQSRVAAIEKDPASVSVGQFLSILKLLNAEFVIRQRDPVQNRIPPQQQALGMSPADFAKQGLAAFAAQEHAKQQALGMSATDYVKKHGLRASTVTLKPQDLPTGWHDKKPKGSW